MKKILSYLAQNHQRVANLASLFSAFVAIPATIIGVWFTVYSINQTEKTVNTQLTEQKKATSMSTVSDYLNFLTDLIVDGKLNNTDEKSKTDEERELENAIANRTQLLIDNIKFPEITSQVIEFLGNNKLGFLFEFSRENRGMSSIRLEKLNLASVELINIEMENPYIYCSNLNKATIINSNWEKSQIFYSNFHSSSLTFSKFNNSNIEWTDFKYSYITNSSFKDSIIKFSDLRGIRFNNNENITREEEVAAILGVLREAKSLYGSLIDKDVKRSLIEQGHDFLFSIKSLTSNNDLFQHLENTLSPIAYSIEKNGWMEEYEKLTKRICQINTLKTDSPK